VRPASGPKRCAAELRRRLAQFRGQLGVIGTGINVIGAIDRFLAGLAALQV
jgi:hypothetical protein